MSVKNIIRILSAILLISTITNVLTVDFTISDPSNPPDRNPSLTTSKQAFLPQPSSILPTLTRVYNYQNISINRTFSLQYTFDKINYINTSLYTNRDNYTLEYACFNDDHLSYYAIYYNCMQNCTYYLDTEYFTNLCMLLISTNTVYNLTFVPLIVYDINVTINYDGSEKIPPVPTPTSVPVPTPFPIPSVPETPSSLEQEMLSPAAIAGIVFGVVLFLALAITGIYFLIKHFSEKPNDNYARE